MKKSKRPKGEDGDGVDFISNMPDGILVSILSRLRYTEEAIRSSILSKRWRYLWTSIPFINIYCYRGSKDEENFPKSKFKEFVYWVLVNKSVDLDRFELSCSNYYSMSTVGRWIHVAVTKNVKQLDLTFSPKQWNKYVEIPHCLVTCASLEVFKLNFWPAASGLRLPSIIGGFGALRVLELTHVHLLEEGDLIKSFLQRCPLLEELTLIDCVMNELDLLCISCPNLKLLRIENNEKLLIRGGIKICCPKLVYLDLVGHIAYKFFFECLHSLKNAMIWPELEGNTISAVLFPGIRSVEDLSILLYLLSECVNAARDPGLPNLNTLGLKTTMDAFTMDNLNSILKHYPKLNRLELCIEQDYHGRYEYLNEADTMRIWSNEVKRVEVFEFNGKIPELTIDWTAGILVMFFTWGRWG